MACSHEVVDSYRASTVYDTGAMPEFHPLMKNKEAHPQQANYCMILITITNTDTHIQ